MALTLQHETSSSDPRKVSAFTKRLLAACAALPDLSSRAQSSKAFHQLAQLPAPRRSLELNTLLNTFFTSHVLQLNTPGGWYLHLHCALMLLARVGSVQTVTVHLHC